MSQRLEGKSRSIGCLTCLQISPVDTSVKNAHYSTILESKSLVTTSLINSEIITDEENCGEDETVMAIL